MRLRKRYFLDLDIGTTRYWTGFGEMTFLGQRNYCILTRHHGKFFATDDAIAEIFMRLRK